MKIENLSQQSALELLGSEATTAEADAMIKWLNASGYSDTSEIPDNVWCAAIAGIAEANGTVPKITGWRDATGASIPAPAGINVADYCRGGKYLGPDEDGVEPVFAN